MKRVLYYLLLLLVCPSLALAQFEIPLDDAIAIYRPQPIVDGEIPNEGTRTEPLVIHGLDYVVDEVLGNHLLAIKSEVDSATSAIPASELNGSLTLAVRWRPANTDRWTNRFLFGIVDPGTPDVQKRCMIYADTANKYYARLFNTNYQSIATTSTTIVGNQNPALNHTDTIVVVKDITTKQNKLYVNGVKEATATSLYDFQNAITPSLSLPYQSPANAANGHFFAWAVWNRALSDEENATLVTRQQWYEMGGSPPPPPEPTGKFKLLLNGVETIYERSTTVKINGVQLPAPADDNDTVIEITEITN
jgi:hypothetical protein